MLKTKLPNQDPIAYQGKSMETTTFTATNGFAKQVFYLSNHEMDNFNLIENWTNTTDTPLFSINKKSFNNNSMRLEPGFVFYPYIILI